MEPSCSETQLSGGSLTQLAARTCQVDIPSVRAVLSALDGPRFLWADGRQTILSGGGTRRLTATGPDRFSTIQGQAAELFDRIDVDESVPDPARPRLVGGFSFAEAFDPDPDSRWRGYAAGEFILPAIQFVTRDGTAWATATADGPNAEEMVNDRLDAWRRRLETVPQFEPGPRPGIRRRTVTPDRREWTEQVSAAVERIRRGSLQKVVLAQALEVRTETKIVVEDVLARLAGAYPDCYRFLVDFGDGSGRSKPSGSFFGVTPERLVTVENGRLKTEALAGSIARGETPTEDEALARQLQESEKNRQEHDFVVEAIRDQLTPLTTDPCCGERTIRKLATVQHLQTPITAERPADAHVLSFVEALHPTPAVGGLPPSAALRTIEDTETFDRGWYAAPVGWFDASGNGSFAVAIRSGIVRDCTGTLFAGDGIVADSDPDAEWDELQLKYRPILDELA